MSGVPVEVAVVDSRSEADLIVGLLRSNGLRAGIWADDAGGTNPELQMGGVRVVVDIPEGSKTKLAHSVKIGAAAKAAAPASTGAHEHDGHK